MTKLEKALEELDSLMNEVNALRKEEEEEEMMDMPAEEEKGMGEYMDEEAKAVVSTLDGAGVEIGEPADRVVVDNGKPKATDMPVVKAFDSNEFSTLDLSNENIEKAYEAFRQEQLEKLAYDNLQKQFESRFAEEVSTREDLLAKAEYDAQTEIASLKEEFTQLRKSLTEKEETILKAQEEAQIKLPSLEEISEMDWNDIHKMAGGI